MLLLSLIKLELPISITCALKQLLKVDPWDLDILQNVTWVDPTSSFDIDGLIWCVSLLGIDSDSKIKTTRPKLVPSTSCSVNQSANLGDNVVVWSHAEKESSKLPILNHFAVLLPYPQPLRSRKNCSVFYPSPNGFIFAIKQSSRRFIFQPFEIQKMAQFSRPPPFCFLSE